MTDQEKELGDLRKLLVRKREEWRTGAFLDSLPLSGWDFLHQAKLLFQKTMAELDQLEDQYDALKETLKNEYRQSIRSPEDAKKLNMATNVFSISVRRNYEYDEEYLTAKASEQGIDPESFYKVTKKFDYKLVPDDLKEELKKSKSLKGITTSFRDKWD